MCVFLCEQRKKKGIINNDGKMALFSPAELLMEPAKMHFLSLQSLYRYHSQLEKGWLSSADEPTHTVTDWSTLLVFFFRIITSAFKSTQFFA